MEQIACLAGILAHFSPKKPCHYILPNAATMHFFFIATELTRNKDMTIFQFLLTPLT